MIKVHPGSLTAMVAAQCTSVGWRDADVEEWCYILGITPDSLYDAFVGGLKYSTEIRTASLDGSFEDAIAVWGVGPSGKPGVGNVWLIATKLADQHGAALHRAALKNDLMSEMADGWLHLEAYVYPRNALHIKWLKLLGFFKTDTKPPFNIPPDVEVWRRNT